MRLLAAAAGLGLLVLGAADARAADPSVERIGWWTRAASASAPAGGVVVGAAADGPESVAAVEVDVGSGVSDAAIALVEAGGSLQDVGSILVCVTGDPWVAADGGDLADAPRPDCEDASAMVREDGRWQADVGPLLAGRTDRVTLMLVPAAPPTPIPGALVPFEVELERPDLTATSTPDTSRPTVAPPSSSTPTFTPTTELAVPPAPPVSAPTTSIVTAPHPASSPTDLPVALGAEETRRVWRWGLWLRIVLAGALAGTVAGVARWKLVARWQTTAP